MASSTNDPLPKSISDLSDAHVGPPLTELREVRYMLSRDFLPVLGHLRASLLISTYQAGKLVAVGRHGDELVLSLHNFERAMGVAVGGPRGRIAVGARGQIWFLESASDLALQLEPRGRYDGCCLTRGAFVSGNIHGHEMAWQGDELWVVNTLFSCLCTLHDGFSFVPRWRPRFIRALAAEDRCHLNGLALRDGRPAFVTAMAQSDTPAGWRASKATSGCVIDVPSGEIVAQGLAMPHSPRWHNQRLWVLDSGKGCLAVVDLPSGRVDSVCEVPGYTRGLAFCGQFAFVGMSKIRETSVFGGVPIANRRDELKCGVAVIDLTLGQAVAYIQFLAGVDEIFDVQVWPGVTAPALCGPFPDLDGMQDIWLVPREDQVEELVRQRRP